jgi:hypothetical protein
MSFSNLNSGFSVLRLLVDPLRGTSIPVGAVAWDTQKDWYTVRMLAPTERLEGITADRRLLLKTAVRQLKKWAERRVAPYSGFEASPSTSEFWDAVRRDLTTGVCLDPPRAMDTLESPDDVDLLFEAVVQPIQNTRVERTRMEGVLKRALGRQLERSTEARLELRAYHAAYERVMRGARGESGIVVLEAVNLAGRHARRDADALVSRLQRIKEGVGVDMETIVGYTASPGGLNGEGHMKDWIQEQVTPHVFDLSKQVQQFRRVAAKALSTVSAQQGLTWE